MKFILTAVAALAALPLSLLPGTSHAQDLQFPAWYGGLEAGANWANPTTLTTNGGTSINANPDLGYAAGGVIGYDFVGPRVELEGVFRRNTGRLSLPFVGYGNLGGSYAEEQIAAMVNVYYDFMAGNTIVPYVGVGAGVSFINSYLGTGSSASTQFAYQGIVGVGWNVNETFRINLDGRYHATTNPSSTNPTLGTLSYVNSSWTVMLSTIMKFGAPVKAPPAPPPAPPPAAPASFMVFFDFDRSDITPQAATTLQQAAQAYKTKGSARVTATGHTDRAGPDQYNMALSLRRANSVKDALVRNGVPAGSITTIGRGETMPMVQTPDGVREPQNRRVEIVMQ